MSFFYRISRPLALAALFVHPVFAQTEPNYDLLELCELSTPGGQYTTQARCGTLSVTEDPNASGADATMIDLAYAVLPARNGKGAPDPVFFLAGGPGQSARETAPMMQRALRDIHANRDLIFLDQRGTGGSNKLNCEFSEDEAAWIEPDPDYAVEALEKCRQGWSADVAHYTTTVAASDIDALRAHLGFETINIIGGSYGTRVGQVYMKDYPNRVRTAILDGIAPMRLALGAEHGPSLDRALEAIIAACDADPACQAAFPELQSAFDQLKTTYDDWSDGPVISVTHPRLGESIEITFSRTVLATALRFLAYDPATQMLLPYLIHEAAVTGQPQRIAAQAMMIGEQMTDAIAIGLNFAVGCAEDWPIWPMDLDVSQTLLGDSIGELYERVCETWPQTSVPEDFHAPYGGDTPILLLSGEFDPVTPPSYGEEVLAVSSNAEHLIAKGRGHIVITLPCMASISEAFISAGTLEGLDVSCMDALGSEPFFTDLLGPLP